jgi:Bifunctional DNA primase/polymerase, N-terminal
MSNVSPLNPPRNSGPIKAALRLARAGFYIYPSPKKDGAAHVRWREGSTRDEPTIIRWWTQWPEDLICLDCGKSEIGVIDVDTLEGHNVDGEGALADAEMANEYLPDISLYRVSPALAPLPYICP